MGGEGFFLMVGALILWTLVGLAVAAAIHLVWKPEKFPTWVIVWTAYAGAVATVAWFLPARPG
jgi:divalent metal cation (Fe/Co/Zn/Cd) transporter